MGKLEYAVIMIRIYHQKYLIKNQFTCSFVGCFHSGINLARMLGDKFLKEQDARFSAEPYISEVVHIDQSSQGFAILAR